MVAGNREATFSFAHKKQREGGRERKGGGREEGKY